MTDRKLRPRLVAMTAISAVVVAAGSAVLLVYSRRSVETGLDTALVGIASIAMFPAVLLLMNGLMQIGMYLRDRRRERS